MPRFGHSLVAATAAVGTTLVWILRTRARRGGGKSFNEATSPRQRQPLTVSAPGKVLLTGGYLILFKPLRGLVSSTTARFHTTISGDKDGAHAISSVYNDDADDSSVCKHGKLQDAQSSVWTVQVKSPQFKTVSIYEVSVPRMEANSNSNAKLAQVCLIASVSTEPSADTEPGNAKDEDTQKSRNPYVENTLAFCFTTLELRGRLPRLSREEQYLCITLQADNCFYSQQDIFAAQNLPMLSSSYAELPDFMVPTGELSKTGLGSSAALVTSLVGAIMGFVGGYDLPRAPSAGKSSRAASWKVSEDLQVIHRLAQLSHVVAQGKVGSGFDVCAAVFGSICYERYSPSLLHTFLSTGVHSAGSAPCVNDLLKVLELQNPWDHVAEPFGLPHGLDIILGDIKQGSSTPSMVKRVKAWKSSWSDDGKALWEQLNKSNERVRDLLHNLIASSESQSINAGENGEGQTSDVDKMLASEFRRVRSGLKEMGKRAGVDIEPTLQTHLCDQMMEIEGVVFAGVPGAGGNDAVFAVYRGGTTTRSRIEAFWQSYRKQHRAEICGMPLRGTPHGEPGLRVELGDTNK